jgi:hypothetical protein
VDDSSEAPGRERPVDITIPVAAVLGVLLLGVLVAHVTGVIAAPLAAVSAAALGVVVVLLAISVLDLVDSRITVGWSSDHLVALCRHPSAPFVALAAGLAFGYFFW